LNLTANSASAIKFWTRKMSRSGMDNNQQTVLQHGRSQSAGFSLVEVMVAMVIGMLGLIVMMQMFSMFEGQKRTTTGGDDAISSGAVSLYEIQRSIQQSGWGISSVQLIGCSVTAFIAGGAAIPLAPVTIYRSLGATINTPTGYPVIPNPDPDTDVIMIMSGNSSGAVEGVNIDSVPAANSYAVLAATSFGAALAGPPAVAADRVVAVPQARPNPCNLNLTSVTGVVSPNVTVAANSLVAIATGDRLFNLGNAPSVRVYAVRNRNLTVCNYRQSDCSIDPSGMTAAQVDAIWLPIANNVVSLRAEYGRDTTNTVPLPSPAIAMDGIVDRWDQTVATPTSAPPVSSYPDKNTQACGLIRVSAVRLALVARSNQPEKLLDGGAHVTNPAAAWTSLFWMGTDTAAHTIDATEAAAVAISLPSPDNTWPTWQDFRYKVFQTVIPLRNITSQGAVREC
jgi:type IV pilus assembly protein PilW